MGDLALTVRDITVKWPDDIPETLVTAKELEGMARIIANVLCSNWLKGHPENKPLIIGRHFETKFGEIITVHFVADMNKELN